jgi:hypothetical protein
MMWKHHSSSQGALTPAMLFLLVVALSFGSLVQASHDMDQEEPGGIGGRELKVATYDNFGNFYKLFYNIIIDAVLVK